MQKLLDWLTGIDVNTLKTAENTSPDTSTRLGYGTGAAIMQGGGDIQQAMRIWDAFQAGGGASTPVGIGSLVAGTPSITRPTLDSLPQNVRMPIRAATIDPGFHVPLTDRLRAMRDFGLYGTRFQGLIPGTPGIGSPPEGVGRSGFNLRGSLGGIGRAAGNLGLLGLGPATVVGARVADEGPDFYKNFETLIIDIIEGLLPGTAAQRVRSGEGDLPPLSNLEVNNARMFGSPDGLPMREKIDWEKLAELDTLEKTTDEIDTEWTDTFTNIETEGEIAFTNIGISASEQIGGSATGAEKTWKDTWDNVTEYIGKSRPTLTFGAINVPNSVAGALVKQGVENLQRTGEWGNLAVV